MDLISLDRWLRLAKTPAFIPKPWLAMEQDLYPGGNATCLASARCGTILRRQCVDNTPYMSTYNSTHSFAINLEEIPISICSRMASLLGRRTAWRHGRTFFFFCIHMDYTSVPFPSPFVFLFFFSINSSKGGGHYDETG